jgi:hypothetical protein
MALDHLSGIVALHVNILPLRSSIRPNDAPLPDEDITRLGAAKKHLLNETVYHEIQATTSQTLAYGLTDSPANLHHVTTAYQHHDLLGDWHH